MKSPTVASAINRALHDILETDSRVYLLGEDIVDPYGGAFKITQGLSERWPERVLSTPISEAALVGVSGGMALRGLRPIVEIMFGDFVTLAFDQIVNHLAKFKMMYNNQVQCPVTIRTPMGGGRGYGPTHSQSLEKYLVGVPGLEVIAPSPMHDIKEMYATAVLGSDDPTIIIENKAMYGWPCQQMTGAQVGDFAGISSAGRCPTITLSLSEFQRADVSLITYGGMVRPALQAAERMLIEHEIFVETIVMGQLAPIPINDLMESVRRSGRAVTLEEGTGRLGIGAEIASLLSEHLWNELQQPVKRVAAADFVVPCTRVLEERVLPGAEDIEKAILEVMEMKLEENVL